MDRCAPPFPTHRRIRADGWTQDRRVTFIVTLAASESVTFAATSAGMSRKAAYALKYRDAAFASLWDRSLAAAKAAHRKTRREVAKGNEIRDGREPRRPINFIKHHEADIAERNRFFAYLESGLPAPIARTRIRPSLAKNQKQSDGLRLESAGRSTCDSAPPPTRRKGESHAWNH